MRPRRQVRSNLYLPALRIAAQPHFEIGCCIVRDKQRILKDQITEFPWPADAALSERRSDEFDVAGAG